MLMWANGEDSELEIRELSELWFGVAVAAVVSLFPLSGGRSVLFLG